MQSSASIMISLQQSAATVLENSVAYAPSLISALLVLLFGWFVARLARAGSRRLLQGLNRLIERDATSDSRLSAGITSLLGQAVFWVVFFFPLTVAARIAQLPTISRWLDNVVSVLPNLLVGVVILVGGYLLSLAAGDGVEQSARLAKASHSALIGRFVQGLVFAVAAVLGLDQMGVDVTLLVALLAVAVGAIFIGFSLAFGFGSRDYVSNLIGARSARRHLNAGSTVRVGGIEGSLLEITQTQIALDTADGRSLVPARLVEERGVLIVYKESTIEEGDNE